MAQYFNITGALTQELIAAGSNVNASSIWLTNIHASDAVTVDLYLEKKLTGKFYIAGGWYGMMAYHIRKQWPLSKLNIISADCDPMCEEYAWELFGDCDIDFRTMDVNDEVDLSEYTAIINTSCEHMEQEDLLSIIEKKQRQTWVAFQTNNYKDLNSHINCWPTAQLFAESLGLEYVAAVETLELKDFNRFMVIGK